jgi:hypothetical protein
MRLKLDLRFSAPIETEILHPDGTEEHVVIQLITTPNGGLAASRLDGRTDFEGNLRFTVTSMSKDELAHRGRLARAYFDEQIELRRIQVARRAFRVLLLGTGGLLTAAIISWNLLLVTFAVILFNVVPPLPVAMFLRPRWAWFHTLVSFNGFVLAAITGTHLHLALYIAHCAFWWLAIALWAALWLKERNSDWD